MHTIHHTDAFIIKVTPTGEANARAWLFTRALGLVVATVQGVRKSGSKLSMQLSEYSFATVDLVRGKDVWRLVNIAHTSNPFLKNSLDKNESISTERYVFGRSFVRTLAAVERFCQGEEAHEELFDHLVSCFEVIQTASVDQSLDPKSFDALSVWKVLVLLGYGVVPDPYQEYFSFPLSTATRTLTPDTRIQLVREVNAIIKETQL
jgi:recombinational DNA repair protein (RecF pathway)